MIENVQQQGQIQENYKKTVQEKYKSSEFILQYMYNEYCKENERRANLESRIAILLTVSTFFAGFILINNQIDINSMIDNNMKVAIVFIVIQSFSWVGLVGGLACFISILVARGYKTITIDNFINIEPQGADKGLIAYELLQAYKECLDYNRKVNDKKFNLTNIGIILISISIAIFLITNIIVFFI